MPLATTHRWTAANLIMPDWRQKENDGSIALANISAVSTDFALIQANGLIGDGRFGATTGDFDAFHFNVSAGSSLNQVRVRIDIDAQILGSALDASFEIYNSAGAQLAAVSDDPAGGADPYYEFDPVDAGSYTVIVRGSGSAQLNPSDAGSGSGSGSVGAYRIFINTVRGTPGNPGLNHFDNSGNTFTGDIKNDVFVGNGGDDSLNGGAGNDLFIWKPGDGSDNINGGNDFDVQEVNASDNPETLTLETAFTIGNLISIDGVVGGDQTLLLSNIESVDVRARGGGDTFTVANLSSTPLLWQIRYWAGAGNDKLLGVGATNRFVVLGEAGNDALRGGLDADNLNGGIGKDLLVGGVGRDVLTGGPGRDRFDFNGLNESTVALAGRDTINGFSHAHHDKIDLSTIDADQRAANPGNDKFVFIGAQGFGAFHSAHPGAFGMVRFAGGIVQGTVDGDMAAEFAIRILGTPAVHAGDYML